MRIYITNTFLKMLLGLVCSRDSRNFWNIMSLLFGENIFIIKCIADFSYQVMLHLGIVTIVKYNQKYIIDMKLTLIVPVEVYIIVQL